MYEEQEVSSELEPELISPEEQDELLDETDKESGEEEENKKIFQELNHTVVQKQNLNFEKLILDLSKSDEEEKILEYTRIHGVITKNNAMELLEVSASTASRVIRKMVKHEIHTILLQINEY